MHMLGVLGQIDGRLTGRIAAADHRHFRPLAQPGLHRRGAEIDAAPLEPLGVVQRQAAVSGAGGDDHRARPHHVVVPHIDHIGTLGAVQPQGRPGGGQRGAELLGLHEGALGQVAAGDAGGKAQVVLDLGTGAGLAARCDGIHGHDVQPFGGGIDRRRQPGRPGADHQHVVDAVGIDGVQAHAPGQGVQGRVAVDHAVGVDQHRGFVRLNAEAFQQGGDIVVAVQVDPLEGARVAFEKLANAEGVRRIARAQQQHVAEARRDQAAPPRQERAQDHVADR